MGAGKSTVGGALADVLGWAFLDLDDEIERAGGKPIREIFRIHGEAHFREMETAALRTLLTDRSAPAVIALGGGTFIQPGNVELLKTSGARVVFLQAPVAELFQRCQQGVPPDESWRPLATNFNLFNALYEQRLQQYSTAELAVCTSGKSAAEVAREIASSLRLVASMS
jgi:shikimate kinase